MTLSTAASGGDLEKIETQLTTLRLEVAGRQGQEATELVEKFVRARFNKGMPLAKLERIMFKNTSEEDEEKAKRFWEGLRASLSIDQYLATQ